MSDPGAVEAVEAIEVPAALDGERLDRAVALLTGWSRADVQAMVAAGAVTVEGRSVPKSHRLATGEVVELRGEPAGDRPPEPDPSVPVDVRHEDAHLVVVSKPPGIVVHPGAGHERGTLVHGLLARYPGLAAVGDPVRPGIVHRLDRDTSGLLLVALTEPARAGLVERLAAREVERRYLALVWGVPEARRGAVDAPIGRSPRRRTRMAVRTGGREARTRFERRAAWSHPEVSLLDCSLETGRTHQVRVHLSAVGHPVVGDPAYGGRREPTLVDRPFLHAWRLALDHPVTGRRLEVEDPLPDDLAAVLRGLGVPDEGSTALPGPPPPQAGSPGTGRAPG